MMLSLSGAMLPPSPVNSVVMPWKILEGRWGLTSMVNSDCPNMSMNPGVTIIPAASMVCFALPRISVAISTMRPPLMASSPEYQGEPVPSMMRPFRIIRSYDGS